jgi:hypothetical protein
MSTRCTLPRSTPYDARAKRRAFLTSENTMVRYAKSRQRCREKEDIKFVRWLAVLEAHREGTPGSTHTRSPVAGLKTCPPPAVRAQ